MGGETPTFRVISPQILVDAIIHLISSRLSSLHFPFLTMTPLFPLRHLPKYKDFICDDSDDEPPPAWEVVAN